MWDLIKRIFHFISTVIFYSIMFIVAIILIMVALYFFDQFQAKKSGQNRAPLFGSYIIITDSMVPAINPGDAVVTMRVDIEDLKKSDVITFISTEHNSVTVTHRIMGTFESQNGGYAFRTKGDHNNVEDSELVTYDRIIGKVILVIPYVGFLQQFITQGPGWFIFFIIPCLWIIISDIIKLIKKASSDDTPKDDNLENKKKDTNSKKDSNHDSNKRSIPLVDDDIKIVDVDNSSKVDKDNKFNSNDYRVDKSSKGNNKKSVVNSNKKEENNENNNNAVS